MKMDEISIFRVEDSPYLGLGFIFVLRMEISIILIKLFYLKKNIVSSGHYVGFQKKKLKKFKFH